MGQAGHLRTQLGRGSLQRPEQPPLPEGGGWLSTAGDRSLRLRRVCGAWARACSEGQRSPWGSDARAGGAVGARVSGRGSPVVSVDSPETAAAAATLAPQEAEKGALELAAGAGVDEWVHTAIEVAQPEDDLEDAL